MVSCGIVSVRMGELQINMERTVHEGYVYGMERRQESLEQGEFGEGNVLYVFVRAGFILSPTGNH